MSVAGFPKIVRFLSVSDSIGSSCPHCGATGRWIWRFQVEDGRELGAMRGCLQLFPVSRVATEHARLMEKAAKAKRRWGGDLGANDRRAIDAIEQFYDGQSTEAVALAVVDRVKRENTARYRRRRV